MKKDFYYAAAALSAVGLLGVGAVSANELSSNFFEKGEGQKAHPRMNIEKKAEFLGVDQVALQEALDSGQKFHEFLAEQGIDKEAVHEKMKAAHEAKLQELVASGEITQEQADRRLENKGEHKKQRGQKRPGPERVAEVLGLDVEQVKADLEAGKTMKEILQANGLDRESVHEKMEAAHEARLSEQVAAGEITQEEADARRERHDKRHERREERHEDEDHEEGESWRDEIREARDEFKSKFQRRGGKPKA
jgi:hypothetical protein